MSHDAVKKKGEVFRIPCPTCYKTKTEECAGVTKYFLIPIIVY
jgi:hypothetical protein